MGKFGEKLAELRQDHKMTQRALAQRLHVTSGTISNYENGNHLPDVDKLVDLADLFGVSTDYLLDRCSWRSHPSDFSTFSQQEIRLTIDPARSFLRTTTLSKGDEPESSMIPMIIMAIEDEDDRSFMANLYVDYQRLMYKVIASYTTNKWDADDIFQSTLPKLIDKLADLRRMSKDKLTNYIYSTCKNTAINYLQKKGGLKEFSFEELSSTIPADEDPRLLSKEDDEDIEALHRAWKKLDPRSQYLLEARYILNKSFEEIAEDINLQSGSVRTAISRARKKARKLILEEKKST